MSTDDQPRQSEPSDDEERKTKEFIKQLGRKPEEREGDRETLQLCRLADTLRKGADVFREELRSLAEQSDP